MPCTFANFELKNDTSTNSGSELTLDSVYELITKRYNIAKKYADTTDFTKYESIYRFFPYAKQSMVRSLTTTGGHEKGLLFPDFLVIDAKKIPALKDELSKAVPQIRVADWSPELRAETDSLLGAILLYKTDELLTTHPVNIAALVYHELAHFNSAFWLAQHNNKILPSRFGMGVYNPLTGFNTNFFEEAYCYQSAADFVQHICTLDAFSQERDFLEKAQNDFEKRNIIDSLGYIKFEGGLISHKDYCIVYKDEIGYRPRYSRLFPTVLKRLMKRDSEKLLMLIRSARMNPSEGFEDALRDYINSIMPQGFYHILNSLNDYDSDFVVNAIAEYIHVNLK